MKNEYCFKFAFTPDWSGEMNMGADQYFGEIGNLDSPLVRLYTWDKFTISFGCNQSADRRLNLELCNRDGIPVVRRPTGGRELLHGHDICYSVVWPFIEGISAVDAKKVFAQINNALLLGLKNLGIDAEWAEFRNKPRTIDGPCFAQVDSGEITVKGRKLIASAQRVFPKSIVQQGSLPLKVPGIDLLKYLQRKDSEIIRTKMESLSTNLSEQLPDQFDLFNVVQCLRAGFEKMYGSSCQAAENIINNYKGIINMNNGIVL